MIRATGTSSGGAAVTKRVLLLSGTSEGPPLGTRVLLTIGAKQLKHFAALQDRLVLVARILPCVASLQQALAAGFTPDRLLGLRPPFSREFNRAVLREYRAEVLVTKASGR